MPLASHADHARLTIKDCRIATTTDEAVIARRRAELEKSVESLGYYLDRLEERLVPILSPAVATLNRLQDECSPRCPESPLAEAIREQCGRVAALESRVRELMDRLEV
jgi:hypothetical protein